MREQQIRFRAPGTIPGQVLSGSTSRPGRPYSVRLRQREALASLRQAWDAGQPAASEKRRGVLVRALGFFNNLW